MNWLGLAVGIIIVGGVVYLMWYNKRRKDQIVGGGSVLVLGFTTVGYNLRDISAPEADRYANRLHAIAKDAWAAMSQVYGEWPEMAIKHITLDGKFVHVTSTTKREVIELVMPGNTIIMRPQGGHGHSGEFWFALELHNLFRGTAFGIDKIYLGESASAEDIRLWDEAQQACKDAVP